MRHRGTYLLPDTPKRRPLARAGTMLGAVVGVGLLAGVSTVVGSAVASPVTARPTATATMPTTESERRLAALERRVAKVERRLDGVSRAARVGSHWQRPTPSKTPSAKPTASTNPSPTTTPRTTPAGAAAGTLDRLFASDSPWNTLITQGAAIDPESGAIVSRVLNNRSLVVNLNVYEFGVPFQQATESTPRVVVNGAAEIGPVPLDPSWRPNEGADHKLNVVDPTTHTVFELQGYDPGSRSVQWAVKKDYLTSLADGHPSDGRAGPTGSGLTQAGGVVRLAEMKAGRIDHALSFITSQPVNRFRYPASHSDGRVGGVGLEEGMRVQLDPDVDLDAIPGITPGEKAIAKALQQYGAYCTDNGGGNNQAMGFYVEKPKPGDADPYPAAGFKEDWAQLPHIPRDKLRVLAADATPRPK